MFLKYLSTNFLSHPPTLVSETRDLPVVYTDFIKAVTQLNPHYKPIDQNLRICKAQYLAAPDSEKNAIDMAFSELTNCLQHFQSLQGFPELASTYHNIISNLLSSPYKGVIQHGLFLLQGLNSVFQDQEAFHLTGFRFEIQWNVYFYLWADMSSKTKIKALNTFLKKEDFSNFFNLIDEKKDNFDFLKLGFNVLHELSTLLWQSQYDLETKLISSCTIDIPMFFIGCLLWHQINDISKSKFVLFFLEPLHLTRVLTFHQNVQEYSENNYPSPLKENSQRLNETLFNILSSKIDEEGIFRAQFLTLLQQLPSINDAIFLSMYVKIPHQLLEAVSNSDMD